VYDQLKRFEQIIFDTLSVLLVLFYSYAAVVQPASTQYHRGIYVIITYVLVFLLYQSKSKLMRVVDYILILLSIVCIGYWILNFEAINYRTGAENAIDKTVAVVGVLIGIELARRVVGNAFVIIGTVMILYGVYGPYAPDLFAHPGDTFPNLCTTIYYMSDGVFGIMANVLATYVILFVLFGAFLEKSGAQKFFIDWPLAAVGHKIGGPAKVSVIASGLFGSISGSAIANTVSTGTFTIPMMKKAGFRPHIAGGIEPAASIGGMFMPPIMGAGGFIMAELTGVPYSRIMLVGLFPAFMYFFSVFVMVHYEAKMHNIVGERSEHSAMEILKKEWFFTLPLVIITIFMLSGYSPGYSAILGLATCIIVSYKYKDTHIDYTLAVVMALVLATQMISLLLSKTVGPEAGRNFNHMVSEREMVFAGIALCVIWYAIKKEHRPAIRKGLKRFLESARSGTENSLKIGATLGVIGIIIGVLTFTGLVLTFADIVIELAGGSLVLTILFYRAGISCSRHGRTGHRGLPDHGRGGRTGPDPSGHQRNRRPHDRLLAVPGFQHHAAGVHRRFCGGHHRQGQHVAHGLRLVQVRQVSVPGAVPVRLRAGLLPERQCHGHRQGLCFDYPRYLALLLSFKWNLDPTDKAIVQKSPGGLIRHR
jgi:TRAP transporter 4TM/12TM fusion protein